MDLVIRADKAVIDGKIRHAAVAVTDGMISAVGSLEDFDAHNKVRLPSSGVLLPGFVDTHVHINEPGTDWEGFATATAAAAAAGITTLVDMPLDSDPVTATADALARKREAAHGNCEVDVAFWGGAVPGNLDELEDLAAAGVRGFKCFLTDSGNPNFPCVSPDEFRRAAACAAAMDAVLLVHAESDHVIVDSPDPSGRSYASFLASRPDASEENAVALAIDTARDTGARMHIVHVSSARVLPMLAEAKRAGVRITAETCPHYLTFAAEDIPDGATQFAACPPIRGEDNRALLWQGLVDGTLDMVVPGTYDLRGEVVDGWETRRHVRGGGDWAIVRLGVGGRLRTIDVDTRSFAGNHPVGCRIDACVLDLGSDPTATTVPWATIVDTVALKPDSHNIFAVDDPRRYTHVRLQLESDGGVARLRAYGQVIPDPALWAGVTVEVSGVEQGGRVEWSSDSFYSDGCALIAPDRPRNMGDGWETRRRRDIGPETHDAVMISFAVPADLQRIEIDTSRFVFNASPEVAVLGTGARPGGEHGWALAPFDVEVLTRTRIAPDARQVFVVDASDITALRVQAYPDGGIARVRAFGRPTEQGTALLQSMWEASAC